MKSVSITIKGRPASKKNSRRFIMRGGRKFSVPSEAHERFAQDALWQLKSVKERFTGPVAVMYYFYQKGRLSQDADNAMTAINDVLQEAGIIDNDKNIRSGAFCIIPGQAEFSTNIDITELPLEHS